MVNSSQSVQGLVGVGTCMESRGRTIVRVGELVRGFGASTGGRVEVVVRSSWSRVVFGMVNATVFFFPLDKCPLWIATISSAASLCMMKVRKGQLRGLHTATQGSHGYHFPAMVAQFGHVLLCFA